MTEQTKARKPRKMLTKPVEKMLTKPVEKVFREDMAAAIEADAFRLQENQSADDLIEFIKQGIKDGTYQPGLTFADFYVTLGGDPATLPGGKVEAPIEQEAAPQGAIATAEAEVSEPIDDLAGYLKVIAKANAKIAEANEIKDRAKDVIKARMGDKEKATVDGKIVATYVTVKATKFLKDKLAEEHPEIVEQYTVPAPHRRFNLT